MKLTLKLVAGIAAAAFALAAAAADSTKKDFEVMVNSNQVEISNHGGSSSGEKFKDGNSISLDKLRPSAIDDASKLAKFDTLKKDVNPTDLGAQIVVLKKQTWLAVSPAKMVGVEKGMTGVVSAVPLDKASDNSLALGARWAPAVIEKTAYIAPHSGKTASGNYASLSRLDVTDSSA